MRKRVRQDERSIGTCIHLVHKPRGQDIQGHLYICICYLIEKMTINLQKCEMSIRMRSLSILHRGRICGNA